MKQKRAWVILLEGIIAVLILFGFVVFAFAKLQTETARKENPDQKEALFNIARHIHSKVEGNESIRLNVTNTSGHISGIAGDATKDSIWLFVNKTIADMPLSIKNRLNFSIVISGILSEEPLIPGVVPEDRLVFTTENLISASIRNCASACIFSSSSRKFRLYLWFKD